MANDWVNHIKEYAKRNNISYGCALSSEDCKNEYKIKKGVKEVQKVKEKKKEPKIKEVPKVEEKKKEPKIKEVPKVEEKDIIDKLNKYNNKMMKYEKEYETEDEIKKPNEPLLKDKKSQKLKKLTKEEKKNLTKEEKLTRKMLKKELKKNKNSEKDNIKEIIKENTEEILFDNKSSELQQLILITPIEKIQKALNQLNYKGRMQTNKIMLNLQLLQNFNTIEKMQDLIDLLKNKPKEEIKEKIIIEEPKTTLSEILENRKKAEKQAKEGSSKMRRTQKQIYNSQTEKEKPKEIIKEKPIDIRFMPRESEDEVNIIKLDKLKMTYGPDWEKEYARRIERGIMKPNIVSYGKIPKKNTSFSYSKIK
jgi:hypothetical protein